VSAALVSSLRAQVVGSTIATPPVSWAVSWLGGVQVTPLALFLTVPLLILGLLVVEAFRRNRRIARDEHALYVRSMYGFTRTIPVSRIHSATFVPHFVNGGPASRLVLRDRYGSTVLRIDSFAWDQFGIALLASTMGSVLEVLPTGLTRTELFRRYPQTTNFWERRGRAAPFLFLGLMVVACAIFILILALLMGLPF
jgi:hypothetical protein